MAWLFLYAAIARGYEAGRKPGTDREAGYRWGPAADRTLAVDGRGGVIIFEKGCWYSFFIYIFASYFT